MKNVSAEEANGLMQAGCPYLDVRSTGEFAQGHPKGAKNVPILEGDPRTGKLVPNPDFLSVVQANFPKDARLIVGCRSGPRSTSACQLLERAGYTDLLHMEEGYLGWSGYPVGTDGETYDSLRKKPNR